MHEIYVYWCRTIGIQTSTGYGNSRCVRSPQAWLQPAVASQLIGKPSIDIVWWNVGTIDMFETNRNDTKTKLRITLETHQIIVVSGRPVLIFIPTSATQWRRKYNLYSVIPKVLFRCFAASSHKHMQNEVQTWAREWCSDWDAPIKFSVGYY